MNIVWFKRDLRIQDHLPLLQACTSGKVLPLYILEPQLWAQPDMSCRQYQFLCECILELDQALHQLGLSLVVRVGNALSILEALHQQITVQALWSHQETWNDWTYQRDIQIKQWAKHQGITWHEPRQHGVVRKLHTRDGWAKNWHQQMSQSAVDPPKGNYQSVNLSSEKLPSAEALGLEKDGCLFPQQGGRSKALEALHHFLNQSGESYSKAMSSPVTAFEHCSRLSPYLAFGVISMREVFHATQKRIHDLKAAPPSSRGSWLRALSSFSARLRWHCHFMQKLEDQPSMEHQNLHSAYRPIQDEPLNLEYFEAWKKGKTGFPMIDACMRALIATGWINFRMRAMLMSFSSYHLNLHWREPSLYLARLFIDYEPGIHYPQTQMQSGTTGMNSIRIYNPIKQSLDHDPDGIFIRKWVPELENMPTYSIHTPWLEPHAMNDYPMPIVDEKEARQRAAKQIYGIRKTSNHQLESKTLVKKHGSRKLPSVVKKRKQSEVQEQQRELPF